LVELAQNVDEFRRHRAETAVVLPQRASGVQRYTSDRKVPFDILVDETREVVKAYGVWQRIGLDAWNISRPAVFLIEKDRSISYSFIGQSQREFPSLEEILLAI
jgi:methyl-accepting chemotaxis protein